VTLPEIVRSLLTLTVKADLMVTFGVTIGAPTVKFAALVATGPLRGVTAILPVVAPTGTVAVICVALTTAKMRRVVEREGGCIVWGGAVALSWAAQPNARAFFVSGLAARGQNDMVLWTSSEVPDMGMGLMDYQTNAAVDRWLNEKVLLAPSVTRCTVPKGVFPGEGAMLRAIAYGNELNLVHPPRPTDPKVPWEPVWATKVRVKSVGTAMLGMPSMERAPSGQREAAKESEPADQAAKEKKPSAIDLLRGVIGK
jgi:hypothetical protein